MTLHADKPQVPRRSTLHSSQAHAKPRPRGVSAQDSSQLLRAEWAGLPLWTQLKLQQQDHRLSQSAETAGVAKLWISCIDSACMDTRPCTQTRHRKKATSSTTGLRVVQLNMVHKQPPPAAYNAASSSPTRAWQEAPNMTQRRQQPSCTHKADHKPCRMLLRGNGRQGTSKQGMHHPTGPGRLLVRKEQQQQPKGQEQEQSRKNTLRPCATQWQPASAVLTGMQAHTSGAPESDTRTHAWSWLPGTAPCFVQDHFSTCGKVLCTTAQKPDTLSQHKLSKGTLCNNNSAAIHTDRHENQCATGCCTDGYKQQVLWFELIQQTCCHGQVHKCMQMPPIRMHRATDT
jgi:hypothetical protein